MTRSLITNTGVSGMTISSANEITMSSQPAFAAKPASQQNNMAADSDVTIVFGTEIFDQNGDFASNTFTAPVTGKYQLSFILRVDNLDATATYYRFALKTSNRSFFYLLEPNLASNSDVDIPFFPAVISVLADMDANDTALVEMNQSGGAAQTDIVVDSYFTGYLAC